MFGTKRYGESKILSCPFCGRQAFAKNSDGVPVCTDHKHASFGSMKCACRGSLELREGKWGPFFTCEKCGIVNMKRALELNPDFGRSKETSAPAKKDDSKSHPMMGNRTTARQNVYKNADGSDKFVRSDDPRFEFR